MDEPTDPFADHGSHFAEPGGAPTASGRPNSPWDLATALSGGKGSVGPGDTVWLRGGTYPGGVTSMLAGAPGAFVVVRAYPGERAVIDGAASPDPTLTVAGPWVMYWGIEFTNSNPDRTRPRPNVVVNGASHTRYVNVVIHDGGVAFWTDPRTSDVEISGAIIYNNGWQAGDRGHGHALYLKSDAGPVVVRGSILFNQFGYGIHAYSNAGSGLLTGIRLEGNVVFNNGALSPIPQASVRAANLLVGGLERADRIVVTANRTYYAPGVRDPNVMLGWDTVSNGSLTVASNVFVGGSPVLDVGYWSEAGVTANPIAGGGVVVQLRDSIPLNHRWEGNRYYRDPSSPAWGFRGATHPFATWQALTHLGTRDDAAPGRPSAPEVFVTPDPYEPGRASVTVYNWNRQGAVPVDLSGVLKAGTHYTVRNVQDLFGDPVASGVYGGGTISLPMTGVAPPAPVGGPSNTAPRTSPDFDVFIVSRQ